MRGEEAGVMQRKGTHVGSDDERLESRETGTVLSEPALVSSLGHFCVDLMQQQADQKGFGCRGSKIAKSASSFSFWRNDVLI